MAAFLFRLTSPCVIHYNNITKIGKEGILPVAKINWGEKLETKIAMLPESPGCYLMKDAEGTIIYVGKAVNLKNRVRSYFRDTDHTPKVAAMIANIDDFDILLCGSNLEALCLECNLIKLHRPH